MSKLEDSRRRITEIDKEMAALFEERMGCAEEIAAFKRERGLPVKDNAREDELIARNCSYISSPELQGYYSQFIRKVIDLSCNYQEKLNNGLKVAFSGTLGAYAHIAAKRMFPNAQYVSYPGFTEAYRAVEGGEADIAVLPIENSYEGEVGAVMDLIFSGSLYANQVIDLPIAHNLLGLPGATLSDIKSVVSHPQAFGQCTDYLDKHGFDKLPYSNTALAAEYVKNGGDRSVAAIASTETAEIFGLQILDSKINDSANNITRFAALSRVQAENKSTAKRMDENFILMFTVKDEAGALVHALNILAAHGYSMRSLRSRPMKELQWKYYFYIEAEGSVHTQSGQDMLRELSAICARLKLVGTFYARTEE